MAAAFATLWARRSCARATPSATSACATRESLRDLGPLAGPTLEQMLNLRLGEQVRQAVVGQAELESGRLPGAQPISAGFADLVGFTSLGERCRPTSWAR